MMQLSHALHKSETHAAMLHHTAYLVQNHTMDLSLPQVSALWIRVSLPRLAEA